MSMIQFRSVSSLRVSVVSRLLVVSKWFVRSLVDARNFLVVVGIIINREREKERDRDERRNKKENCNRCKRERKKMRMNHLVDEEGEDA